jgi:hypothetical protein
MIGLLFAFEFGEVVIKLDSVKVKIGWSGRFHQRRWLAAMK